MMRNQALAPGPAFFTFAVIFSCLLWQPFTARPAEPPATTQPPWNQTQERRPKEVDDKANETPLASCESTDPITGATRVEVSYLDANTGTRTTVRRIQVPEQVRIGSPAPAKTVWEIIVQEPDKPKKKITYELDSKTGDGTRTERSGKDKPSTKRVSGEDLVTPPKPAGTKQSLLSPPFTSRLLARTADLNPEIIRRIRSSSSRDLFAALGTAGESPSPTGSVNSKADTANKPLTTAIKLVTYGDPPRQTFGLLDAGPPMTADEYVLSEALDTLDYEWESYGWGGPGVFYPGDSFHTGDGQHIDIVGDWSLARVAGGYLLSCHGFDDDDDDWLTRYRINFSDKIERVDTSPL